MNFLRQGFQKLSSDIHTYTYKHTDRQTDRHDQNYIPRRIAGDQVRSLVFTIRITT